MLGAVVAQLTGKQLQSSAFPVSAITAESCFRRKSGETDNGSKSTYSHTRVGIQNREERRPGSSLRIGQDYIGDLWSVAGDHSRTHPRNQAYCARSYQRELHR